jgi:hypothetical protein
LKVSDLTPLQIKALEAYDGPLSNLPPPERWFLKIKDYPNLEARLECMEYLLQFDEIVLDVQPFIQTAYFALKQLNTSSKLKALLRVTGEGGRREKEAGGETLLRVTGEGGEEGEGEKEAGGEGGESWMWRWRRQNQTARCEDREREGKRERERERGREE